MLDTHKRGPCKNVGHINVGYTLKLGTHKIRPHINVGHR